MVEKLKSVTTYIIIGVVVGIFIFLANSIGSDLADNDNAELSQNSLTYINNITGKNYGRNTSIYSEKLELSEESGDNKFDFVLDFLFGKSMASKIRRFVDVIFGVPSFFLRDVFRLQVPSNILAIIDWFVNIMVVVAIVYYIRRGEG